MHAPLTPLRTGDDGIVRGVGDAHRAVKAILDEARAWGLLGFDLEWISTDPNLSALDWHAPKLITWIGLGHMHRAISLWAPTLPQDALDLIKQAIADPTLPKIAHNIQADIGVWEQLYGVGACGGIWEDCHVDSATEFLTTRGWKRFDDVTKTDLIGVIDKNGAIAFERPLRRISRMYMGRVFVLQTQHTRAVVTANHSMLSRMRRRTSKSWQGALVTKQWQLTRAGDMLLAASDTFDVMRAPVALHDAMLSRARLSAKDRAWLQLSALFVTDGCLIFRNGKLYGFRISQVKNGRAVTLLRKLACIFPASYHETVKREPWRKKRTVECVWSFNNQHLAQALFLLFGRYSRDRRLLPDTVFAWSYAARKTFFEALFLGDGNVCGRRWVYLTTSKALADGVQVLALSLGYPAIVGLGGVDTYAVWIRPDLAHKSITIRAREAGCNAAFKYSYKAKKAVRVVCFVTKAGTLVTRSKGKPAFHGNSMLAHHCACPGVLHDLQSVATQFLVVPPWKTWHRNAQVQAKQLEKEKAKYEKAQASVEKKHDRLNEKLITQKEKLCNVVESRFQGRTVPDDIQNQLQTFCARDLTGDSLDERQEALEAFIAEVKTFVQFVGEAAKQERKGRTAGNQIQKARENASAKVEKLVSGTVAYVTNLFVKYPVPRLLAESVKQFIAHRAEIETQIAAQTEKEGLDRVIESVRVMAESIKQDALAKLSEAKTTTRNVASLFKR